MRQLILDSKALIPVGVVVSLLGLLIGATAWLTAMYNKSEAQATTIQAYQHELELIKEKQQSTVENIYGIKIELEAIRGQLSVISENLKRR